MERYMLLDAPRKFATPRFPRFAARAAPAAICCFLDRAGITISLKRVNAETKMKGFNHAW